MQGSQVGLWPSGGSKRQRGHQQKVRELLVGAESKLCLVVFSVAVTCLSEDTCGQARILPPKHPRETG